MGTQHTYCVICLFLREICIFSIPIFRIYFFSAHTHIMCMIMNPHQIRSYGPQWIFVSSSLSIVRFSGPGKKVIKSSFMPVVSIIWYIICMNGRSSRYDDARDSCVRCHSHQNTAWLRVCVCVYALLILGYPSMFAPERQTMAETVCAINCCVILRSSGWSIAHMLYYIN